MSLRNSQFVIGLAVYTGSETKIQQNSIKSTYKKSKVTKFTEKQIVFILSFQICISAVAGAIGATWQVKNVDLPYISFSKDSDWDNKWGYAFILTLGKWFLIFTNFVPLSMLISLEFVKFY